MDSAGSRPRGSATSGSTTYQKYYYLVMPVMLLGVFFSFQILRSRLGRAFMAVREDPVAAAAAGVNVRGHKMVAFLISAGYAGFAGGLYAHMLPGYLNPRNFTIIEMVTLLLMVVLGGLGHIWGGIIGAILVTIVYDITKDYYHYSLLLFGAVIVLTVLFMPKGIGGIIDRFIATKRFIALREGRENRGVQPWCRRCCLERRTCRNTSAVFRPSVESTSRSRQARSAGSSVRTAPARASFFNLVSGIYQPDEGSRIWIDEPETTHFEPHRIAALACANVPVAAGLLRDDGARKPAGRPPSPRGLRARSRAVVGTRRLRKEERRVRER